MGTGIGADAGLGTGAGARAESGPGTSAGVTAGGGTAAGSAPGGVSAGMETSGLRAAGTVGAGEARVGEEGVIPIVEEKLRVGKRDTEHGRIRVRSYVIETPVTEQVSLREEYVEVERRTVDRPLSDADNAFREQTIEAVEHREEPVVSKEARVVGEVAINKGATEHTETVKETVRRQDVEVEDTRGTKGTGTPGTTGTTDTSGTAGKV
ncbi:YsnF/AvaK domain-containing protein [Roseomonas marmotae]|uniref:YsnF/AvaK domain-containing protein n=2 Tax=Roseomonas marmotae TaxID=2768161 RepID=A0ABS3KDN1_9PROT|nr:YsnF/AvaK domain-containing protein [Roseomonas marmotae]QTI80759.1 YsnF/AvaK domain-containing protein [Roseomonas marmotae]